MFNQNTPFHNIYTSMTCPCAQCRYERNAQTTILPRLNKTTAKDVSIVEIVTAINAETGARVTYHWPVQR